MAARPSIFDLSIKKLAFLYEEVVEIDERVTIETFAMDPNPEPIDVKVNNDLAVGQTGEIIRIIARPDMAVVERQLVELREKGFTSIALALMHSYTFTDHEQLIADKARFMGFSVSVSSELQPMVSQVLVLPLTDRLRSSLAPTLPPPTPTSPLSRAATSSPSARALLAGLTLSATSCSSCRAMAVCAIGTLSQGSRRS